MSIIQGTEVIGYDSATISSTAQTLADIGFAAAVILRASEALITVESDQVRFRYDGTAPTAAEGHLLEVSDKIIIIGNGNLRDLQFIRVTTDASVRITLEGRS